MLSVLITICVTEEGLLPSYNTIILHNAKANDMAIVIIYSVLWTGKIYLYRNIGTILHIVWIKSNIIKIIFLYIIFPWAACVWKLEEDLQNKDMPNGTKMYFLFDFHIDLDSCNQKPTKNENRFTYGSSTQAYFLLYDHSFISHFVQYCKLKNKLKKKKKKKHETDLVVCLDKHNLRSKASVLLFTTSLEDKKNLA